MSIEVAWTGWFARRPQANAGDEATAAASLAVFSLRPAKLFQKRRPNKTPQLQTMHYDTKTDDDNSAKRRLTRDLQIKLVSFQTQKQRALHGDSRIWQSTCGARVDGRYLAASWRVKRLWNVWMYVWSASADVSVGGCGGRQVCMYYV